MNDYWNSPAAARAMHSVGVQEGQKVGYQQGLREGFQQGRETGYREGVMAMQTELDGLQDLLHGLAQILGASSEVLVKGCAEQKIEFARRYLYRINNSLASDIIKIAPHQDERLSGMKLTIDLIGESLRALQRHNFPQSPK